MWYLPKSQLVPTYNSQSKAERIVKSGDGIPDKVFNEIFSKKLKTGGASEKVYSYLKKMMLTGKLKKGESLSYERIVRQFKVSREVAHRVISRLKKDRLVVSKGRLGSFVV